MALTTPTSQIDTAPATLPSLSGLHHLGLTVRDIDQSERWYADVLGMVRVFEEPHPAGGGHTVVINRPDTYVFLGLDHHPQADLELFDERRDCRRQQQPRQHLAGALSTRCHRAQIHAR